MSNFLGGSMCLTDLVAQAQLGHSAFSKGKNGKVYFNFNQWLNDKKDQYGNDSSLLLNSSKEMKENEGKIYIGNAKYIEAASAPPLEAGDPSLDGALDDLPFN